MAATHHLIDAQFDRAVEIVQSLPRTGPIQTDYEEKLQMYSLYKQATVGNVQSSRPVFLDVLGRAKWDAWAKHKDMELYEAKWLYVEALLKVLRRYPDKTIAQSLVQELDSYAGDPSNLVLSRTSMRSTESESSGSTTSQAAFPTPSPSSQTPPSSSRHLNRIAQTLSDESSSENEIEDDEIRAMHHRPNTFQTSRRPHSSHSSRHYQTPITGSVLSQNSGIGGVPDTQPLPIFKTPSAFPAPSSASTPASGSYYPRFMNMSREETGASVESHRQHHTHVPLQGSSSEGRGVRPASRMTLEDTIENVQAHLAALTERLGILESSSLHKSTSSSFKGSPKRTTYSDLLVGSGALSGSGRLGSPSHACRGWDLNDLGLWSHILNPLSRVISFLRRLTWFFASDANRSPVKVIMRRLCLDLSFLVCVVVVLGTVWRRSGVRRREVKVALLVLWRAIVGTRASRSLHERGT